MLLFAVLVASTMFFPVCERTEHTGPFLDLMVLDGISYEKYHSNEIQSSIIDIFRTIHDFCASSVDFIMTDDSQ